MNDWSESYIKLEQAHKELKDALNQERYEDAEELTFSIAESLYNLQAFIAPHVE
jgi:hypothetical protein